MPYPSFQEIHRKSEILIADQYGNYVIQHILEHGANPDRQRVLTSVKGRIVQLSQHKFASNVIEKCVTSSSREDRVIIINEVCQNPGIDRKFMRAILLQNTEMCCRGWRAIRVLSLHRCPYPSFSSTAYGMPHTRLQNHLSRITMSLKLPVA